MSLSDTEQMRSFIQGKAKDPGFERFGYQKILGTMNQVVNMLNRYVQLAGCGWDSEHDNKKPLKTDRRDRLEIAYACATSEKYNSLIASILRFFDLPQYNPLQDIVSNILYSCDVYAADPNLTSIPLSYAGDDIWNIAGTSDILSGKQQELVLSKLEEKIIDNLFRAVKLENLSLAKDNMILYLEYGPTVHSSINMSTNQIKQVGSWMHTQAGINMLPTNLLISEYLKRSDKPNNAVISREFFDYSVYEFSKNRKLESSIKALKHELHE